MPRIINAGRELLRINTEKNYIENSTTEGRSWIPRCANQSYGIFVDMIIYGSEILACTSKGIYASKDSGRSWTPRCINPTYGEFMNIQDAGQYLIATTSKGLFCSKDSGRSWIRR